MCLWPDRVEVQERRPRTWNEPRHKRLSFVRGSRDSHEWTPPPRRLTQVEIWYRQRAHEMEQRFRHHVAHQELQGFQDPRMIQLGPPRDHHQLGHEQHGNQGGRPQIHDRSHHSEEDIVRIEDDDHHGHDGHDGHGQGGPRYILVEPSKSQLPKGYKAHAKKKSRRHKKKHANSFHSSEDSSSSDDSSGFTEGYRAGRRSLSRRAVPRGRSRSRFTDDSFEDLVDSRHRSRSRGGRRH